MSSWDVAQQIAQIVASNCTDVIVCPGSRNAPLSIALATQRGVRVHTRIDERSASFTALGMARVLDRPVPVVVTSGTAIANCLPAMVEAHHADVPMAIISADRPSSAVGSGASQTIDQRGLFGVYAPTVSVVEHATPTVAAAQVRRALRSHKQAHINIGFDMPLVPQETAETRPEAPDHASRAALHARPAPYPQFDWGVLNVDLSKRVLVIAGDGAWAVDGLEDCPTIVEPTAPQAYHPVHPLAANVFLSDVDIARPEHIIVVGHPTLHRQVMALMSSATARVSVLSRSASYTDVAGVAADIATSVRATGEVPRDWLTLCEAASTRAAEAVRETLADGAFGFTGLHVAAAIADNLGVGDTLVLGASNPVRDASLVGLPFEGVDTYSPRGAAGIDGTVSQSIGVALATQSLQPDLPSAPRTVALMGDVTALHDVGGLLMPAGSAEPENMTIVVANDCGGGIFELLEQGADQHRGYFERVFGTPHDVNWEGMCAAYGVAYDRVDNAEQLQNLLDQGRCGSGEPGVRLIEARTTRSTRRDMHATIAERVALPK